MASAAPLAALAWVLLLLSFVRFRGKILFLCRGVVLTVARHSLGNFFRRKRAVILGLQNVVLRTRIGGHCLSSLSSMWKLFGASPRWLETGSEPRGAG